MSIDDERVRFYLRHREQLEEWQALRGEAAAAIDDWLTTLRPDIESSVDTLGGDVQFAALLDETGYPSMDVSRRWWPGADKPEADVLVGTSGFVEGPCLVPRPLRTSGAGAGRNY